MVQEKPSKISSVLTHVVTFLSMELNTVEWTIKWPKPKREAVQRKMKDLLQGTHQGFWQKMVGALVMAGQSEVAIAVGLDLLV